MDPVTKLLAASAIGVMSYFIVYFSLGILMMTRHEEVVGENEVLTEACANHARDKQFLVVLPALAALVVASSFYLFWYQYLPR